MMSQKRKIFSIRTFHIGREYNQCAAVRGVYARETAKDNACNGPTELRGQ